MAERLRFSLGIRLGDGSLFTLLEAGTPVPTSRRMELTVAEDNQSAVEFEFVAMDGDDMKSQMWFREYDLPPARAGDRIGELEIRVGESHWIEIEAAIDGRKAEGPISWPLFDAIDSG